MCWWRTNFFKRHGERPSCFVQFQNNMDITHNRKFLQSEDAISLHQKIFAKLTE